MSSPWLTTLFINPILVLNLILPNFSHRAVMWNALYWCGMVMFQHLALVLFLWEPMSLCPKLKQSGIFSCPESLSLFSRSGAESSIQESQEPPALPLYLLY